MNGNIEGKVVVITGASSGLGETTARYLAERGATVALGARRAERLQALVDEITAKGGQAFALATDVTDAAQVQALVDGAVERFGRIDVMLNNAGLMAHSSVERRNRRLGPDDRRPPQGRPLRHAAALPHMQRQKAAYSIATRGNIS
jgi:NADP-dependent 3-hydroxy acid dehydrogenase YdfG